MFSINSVTKDKSVSKIGFIGSGVFGMGTLETLTQLLKGTDIADIDYLGNPTIDECIKIFPLYDLIITASYGKIFPLALVYIHDIINVHPSPLPDYWGAAPVQRQLMDGKTLSCVTLVHTDTSVDRGAILGTMPFNLTSPELSPYQHVNLHYAYTQASTAAGHLLKQWLIGKPKKAKKIKSKELQLTADDGDANSDVIRWSGKDCKVMTRYGEFITFKISQRSQFLKVGDVFMKIHLTKGMQLGDVVRISKESKEKEDVRYGLCLGRVIKDPDVEFKTCEVMVVLPVSNIKVAGKKFITPKEYLNGIKNKKEVKTLT